MNKLNITVIIKKDASNPKNQKIHLRSIEKVEQIIQSKNLNYKICSRHFKNNIENANLIITVGGDGTFLHASHLLNEKQILMGINSVPQASHGAYCISDADNFEKYLSKYLLGKLKATPLYRLQALLNHAPLFPLALNDVLFCNPCPAGTSRYEIRVGKQKEEQKSSGVWIATASGSTAAIKSAGGKVLKAGSEKFEFVVREPFAGGKKILNLTQRTLEKKQKITFHPRMPRALIFIDGSHHEFEMEEKDVLEVKLYPKPVLALIRR